MKKSFLPIKSINCAFGLEICLQGWNLMSPVSIWQNWLEHFMILIKPKTTDYVQSRNDKFYHLLSTIYSVRTPEFIVGLISPSSTLQSVPHDCITE